ncbi:hypothetical protein HMPREF0063_10933 [Aeromicrobium marinum DSM 15272]|uniref:Uncharacterized protein n=1 Tax=Aeromicrobium marinum DSM 15272 TaxID=585531 RepID=E2SAE3_9ACTN|nr:hypothetical protein HMPREF0063_10933 [Aeromicrobium marinum DSM 15272]
MVNEMTMASERLGGRRASIGELRVNDAVRAGTAGRRRPTVTR